MKIKNPYSLTEQVVKDNARDTIKSLLEKGYTIETIKNNLSNGIESCNRKIKRNSFNLDAIAKKEWLTHQLNAINHLS